MKPRDENTTSVSLVAGEESLKWNGTYTWNVENFTKLDESRMYSPEFEVGGYFWRLMLFPKGNKAKGGIDHISVYLEFPEATYTPQRMYPKATFKITAMKSTNPGHSRRRESTRTFTVQQKSWGFAKFLSLERVQNPEADYLVNDELTLHVKINVHGRNLGTLSKRETGFMGIKSYGETSLLTSFLQCLYQIKMFRKVIYQTLTVESDDRQKSAPLALQHLFYKLRRQNMSAKTKELVQALDWDCNDLRLQHDVHEIRRTLFGKLSEEDKTGNIKNCISELFMGEYSSCKEPSTCKESYVDIPLDIVECKDIYASLERFCQTKRLEEDNHERTTRNGVGGSKQYVLFDSFPTVLLFHLKRCYYSPDRNAIVKMNSHYEFYDELDLDYNESALLSKNADRTVENKYKLHSVLAHKSGPGGGGYFALIRRHEKWYKFDNEVVKAVSLMEAIDAQFGDQNGTAGANFSKGFESIDKSAAVMLIYIRNSKWNPLMCKAKTSSLPKQVRASFETERMEKEKRQKEKQEAHLYVIIKLATEFHFATQIGKSCYFGLVDFDAVKEYRIVKKTPFEDLKEMVSEDFGIQKHLQRFWLWSKRTNNTIRICEPLTEGAHKLKTVLDLRHVKKMNPPPGQEKTALMTINLFLETPKGHSPGNDGALHTIQQNELLIFVKYYDPALMALSYLGHLFIERTSSFRSIFETAKKMAGLGPEDKVIGVKEVQCLPEIVCLDLLPEKTSEETQLMQGDIIIVQKVVEFEGFAFPLVSKYLESLQSSQENATKSG